MIPYSTQTINDDDVEAAIQVLRHEWLTQGERVDRFETDLASYCGAEQAAAVSSGSAALHLACLAMDFGPGDVLWTSPLTFASTANCAMHCGGSVDFVDIDPATGNLSVADLERRLEEAGQKGRLPKIVIPVHYGGQSCDMAAIAGLARQYGFRVVEDAAHALGGRYRSRPVGSCAYSDCTIFSFHPVKSITTGEGGAVVTNDAELAARVRRLRSHGITREPDGFSGEASGPWYYEQAELGFNYRLTDIQAALGSSQLKRLDGFVAARRGLAQVYDRELADLPLSRPESAVDAESSWHLYPVRFPEGAHQRRAVFEGLRDAGIGTQVHYLPVHLHPYYRERGFSPGDFPQAEAFSSSVLSLPLFPGLTSGQQARVVDALAGNLPTPGPSGGLHSTV